MPRAWAVGAWGPEMERTFTGLHMTAGCCSCCLNLFQGSGMRCFKNVVQVRRELRLQHGVVAEYIGPSSCWCSESYRGRASDCLWGHFVTFGEAAEVGHELLACFV